MYDCEYEPDDGTNDCYTINFEIDTDETPSGPYHSGYSFAFGEIVSVYKYVPIIAPHIIGTNPTPDAEKPGGYTTEEVDLEGAWYMEHKEAIEREVAKAIEGMGDRDYE